MEKEKPRPVSFNMAARGLAERSGRRGKSFSRKRNGERERAEERRERDAWELETRKRKGTRTDSEQTGAVVPDGILIGSRGSSEKVAKQNKSASRQVGPLFLRYFSLSPSLTLLSRLLSVPRHDYGARVMHIHVWHSYARN